MQLSESILNGVLSKVFEKEFKEFKDKYLNLLYINYNACINTVKLCPNKTNKMDLESAEKAYFGLQIANTLNDININEIFEALLRMHGNESLEDLMKFKNECIEKLFNKIVD